MSTRINAWIGPGYNEQGRILIMMESTYEMLDADGRQMPDYDYVPLWCVRHNKPEFHDRTFDAVYTACAAPGESRLDWWSRVAFVNLVPDNLGPTNDVKVTSSQLRAGATTLPDRLRTLDPRVVWVASKRVQPYALPAIKAHGCRVVTSNHPSRAPYAVLRAAWAEASARECTINRETMVLERGSAKERGQA